MKIGILTFHQSYFRYVQKHNYGAVLQMYALQETIKTISGVKTVEIINYIPAVDVKNKHNNYFNIVKKHTGVFSKMKAIIALVLTFPKIYFRRRAFMGFLHSYLTISRKRYYSLDGDSGYDFYILGSDQIWNKKIFNGYEPAYFGFFNTNKNAKKVAYAASAGFTPPESSDKLFFKKALKNFENVSVREKSLEELLRPLTEKKIQTVLDPTLLLPSGTWDKILKKPGKTNYILLYFLSNTDAYYQAEKVAESIAEKEQCEIVSIVYENSWRSNKRFIQTASPNEFIGWFKYASYVITNSFHGLAFAINYNRPFIVLPSENRIDDRMLHLLKTLDLTDRVFTHEENAAAMYKKDINWDEINKKLDCERNFSISFLHSSLNVKTN